MMCASNKLEKRRREEPRGLTPTPSRDRDLWHSLCHSLCWQLHLSSTPAPPHRCGPDERWSWQGWGTKIWVMLWLPMPHWQISQRCGSSSRLKMMTLLTSRINDFHFQCQNVNNQKNNIDLFVANIPRDKNVLTFFFNNLSSPDKEIQ